MLGDVFCPGPQGVDPQLRPQSPQLLEGLFSLPTPISSAAWRRFALRALWGGLSLNPWESSIRGESNEMDRTVCCRPSFLSGLLGTLPLKLRLLGFPREFSSLALASVSAPSALLPERTWLVLDSALQSLGNMRLLPQSGKWTTLRATSLKS